MNNIIIRGTDLEEVVDFWDEGQGEGKYKDINITEERELTPDEVLTGPLNFLSIGGGIARVLLMIADYLDKDKKNEMTIEMTGEADSKITIQLKNLSRKDINEILEDFKKNG